MPAFGREILFHSFAEGASVIANDIIVVRVVTLPTPKDMNAYLLLCEFRGFVPNMPVTYMEQKFGEERGTSDALAD